MSVSRRLLERAAAGEDVDQLEREAQAVRDEIEAEAGLCKAIDRNREDMTGQDGEDEIDRAADDLIAARDRRFKVEDPEWHAERRQMGLL